MDRKRVLALIGAGLVALVMALPVGAADGVSATLGGKPISIERVGHLSCHDLDYPMITCFGTTEAMRSDVAHRLARSSPEQASALATGYVIVYEHVSFAGANLLLSANQPWLSSVGWNDRISSFKSFGATGTFREDSPSGGFIYSYGPSTQVAGLSGTYNDKFSAFYIN